MGITQAIALIMPGFVEECAVETNPKTLSFTCVFPCNQSWDAGICWAGYNGNSTRIQIIQYNARRKPQNHAGNTKQNIRLAHRIYEAFAIT